MSNNKASRLCTYLTIASSVLYFDEADIPRALFERPLARWIGDVDAVFARGRGVR